MKTETALALAFEFDKLPKELKDVAVKHRDNYLALKKAQDQSVIWEEKKISLQKSFNESLKAFNEQLDKWKPESDAIEGVRA